MNIIARVVGYDYEEEKEYLTSETTCEDIGADSLDVVEVVMETDKEFGIALPDDKIEMCYTIGDFIELVRKFENG
jgi:acyl carrier protein